MKSANKILDQARAWIGCKEADGSHKKIIDTYNGHSPRARGYKVRYTDSWCATFVSAVAIACGYTDIIPTECGCQRMIDLFKQLGCWKEADNYVPTPGDVCFYDWDDSGKGDCTGWSDHVGYVEKVEGDTITLIEGNRSNRVKRCTIKVNGRYIRGYGVPKYGKAATAPVVTAPVFAKGGIVRINEKATHYYPGGSGIPDYVKQYEHIITQTATKGKNVYKGGALCVLLGMKRKTGTKKVVEGINTWVSVDCLDLV